MKSFLIGLLGIVIIPFHAFARDYMVDFVIEHYQEEQSQSGPMKKLYHTIQVDSVLGSKLLILTGDDLLYRSWLRAYFADHRKLIVKVPETEDERFRRSSAFEIDVTAIHPILGGSWKEPDASAAILKPYQGDPYVLIVDDNPDRRKLVEMVVKQLGYPVSIVGDGITAWERFQVQPDRYALVIADRKLPGLDGPDLIEKIKKIEPSLPVIIGLEYSDSIDEKLVEKFSDSNTIVIKPVVLRELTQTITRLLNNSV